MPIYEYECRKCKAHTEILQKMTDKPLVKCRKCGGRLEKQWSQSGFQFKGSGWYVTDYAAKKAGGKEEKTSSDSEAKTEAKTTDNAATKEIAATQETTANKETTTTRKAADKKSTSSKTTSGS